MVRINLKLSVHPCSAVAVADMFNIINIYLALTPHLEAMSFDLDKFFSILHGVGGVSAVLFFMLLCDRCSNKARNSS